MRKFSNKTSDYEKIIRSGRSQGRGSDFKPGLRIQDVSSHSVRYRVFLLRFNRILHLMSNAERVTALLLDWDPCVKEIREQFILEPNITLEIANELGFLHPGYTNNTINMTTDFLVTKEIPKEGLVLRAYQIKSNESDITPRVRAKLKIEESYWKIRDVKWTLVFSDKYNKTLCKNLDLLYPFRNQNYSEDFLYFLKDKVLRFQSKNMDMPFSETNSIKLFDDKIHGQYLDEAIKILIGHQMLFFNINYTLLFNINMCDITEDNHG